MYVENGEKDADLNGQVSLACRDPQHFTVRGRNDHAVFGRNLALRIAKKEKHEEGKDCRGCGQRVLMEEGGESGNQTKRNQEAISVSDDLHFPGCNKKALRLERRAKDSMQAKCQSMSPSRRLRANNSCLHLVLQS